MHTCLIYTAYYQSSAIKSMRRLKDETQVGLISLPAAISNKLLCANKITIGWVNCRIRELARPARCFKCLEFGHTYNAQL